MRFFFGVIEYLLRLFKMCGGEFVMNIIFFVNLNLVVSVIIIFIVYLVFFFKSCLLFGIIRLGLLMFVIILFLRFGMIF